MYSTYFQEWLSETFKPCTLVYSSDMARSIIKKNNLSPADFLRPLGDFTGKKIEIPFSETEIISCTNFQIDFYDNDKFKSIKKIDIQNYIDKMFEINSPKWDLSTALLNKNKKNIEDFLPKIKYYSSPKFTEYEKTLFECLYFSEYELYQQPLINIFISSSLDEPSAIINLLNKKENIPKLILQQIYDPAQENLLIILNDLSDPNYIKLSSEEKEKNIAKFKLKFSNYSIINLDINSQDKNNNSKDSEIISDLYKKYFHKLDMYDPNNDFYRKKDNIYGAYISSENINKYKDNFYKYFNFFLTNNFIQQINRYLEIVQNNSGIINFFSSSFSLLTKKEEINFYPNTKIYKLTELERAYYNLGLINFYFHNYNKAFEYFKELKGMVNNKSVKHSERIKELLTICKYISTYANNQFNFVDEMLAEGTFEQLIRNQLIIIKMYENNEDLNQMIANIICFIDATKIKFVKEETNEIKENENNEKKINNINNASLCFKYLYCLLYEKISIYYISHNYYRKFQMFMAITGDSYSILSNSMKVYSLISLSYLLNVLDETNSSFLNLKLFYNNKLGEICKNLNYWESNFKFSKNSFELLTFIKNKKKNSEIEQQYFENYLNSVKTIQTNNINCTNIDINSLEIPQVDNSSLFMLEENDYKIKLGTDKLKEIYKKENIKNPLTWMEFNKYSEKLVENYYVYLIDPDLLCIKMLYDLSNRKLGEMVNIKNRKLQGNINKKLYVNINIKNPLTINLELSSIRLNCEFYPDINFLPKDKDTNPSEEYLIFSEENLILKSFEDKDILLNVESTMPGEMVIKGLDFILFNKCKITHLFSIKNRKRLYAYRPKYSIKFIDIDDSYNDLRAKTDMILVNHSIKTRRRTSSIYKKKRIEYIINDLSEDLYISFPKGNEIDVYLYQFILFPISITNNSKNIKIKRFSIFLENSDDTKIKTFFKYITKKIYINRNHNNAVILIPFIPLSTGDIFIKIIIKFEDEIRVKPVEIKRAIIKINVKESISFEFKEICKNYTLSKNEDIYNSYDILNFNIKTDLRITNKENLLNLSLDKPIFNQKKYNMLDIKNYLINDKEIHQKYTFQKFYSLNNNNDKNNIQYNFDFIKEEMEKSNIDLKTNNHIIEKLNKTLNNINNNYIFFPWNCYEEKDNHKEKINGLYPYNIKLKGPEPTKNIIRELFYHSTTIEVFKQKMSPNKTLVVLLLTLNKKELITFNNIIDKYEIFVNKKNPEINWIGTQRYTINNILDDNKDNKNIFKCNFSFITTLKGMVEVNRLSVLLYKRMENKNISLEYMVIEHIAKPISVYLD